MYSIVNRTALWTNAVQRIRKYSKTFSITVACCLFIIVNYFDYTRYKQLIPSSDYFIGYGVPFVFVVSGGFVTAFCIVWRGVIGDIAVILFFAGILTATMRAVVR